MKYREHKVFYWVLFCLIPLWIYWATLIGFATAIVATLTIIFLVCLANFVRYKTL